jgi:hypothetical protein
MTNKALIMRFCLYIPAFVLCVTLLPFVLNQLEMTLTFPALPAVVHDFGHGLGVVAVITMLLGLYFLPTLVAYQGRHHNVAAICTLNFLLGWTLLGWIIALVWAMTVPHAVAKH